MDLCESSTCFICLEQLSGWTRVSNPCGHLFHQVCCNLIASDLDKDALLDSYKISCPVCNKAVTSYVRRFPLFPMVNQENEFFPSMICEPRRCSSDVSLEVEINP